MPLDNADGATTVADIFGAFIPDQYLIDLAWIPFDSVPPGEYVLIYQLTAAWGFTYQDQSGLSTDEEDVNNNSDLMMGLGKLRQIHTIVLESDETDNTTSASIYN